MSNDAAFCGNCGSQLVSANDISEPDNEGPSGMPPGQMTSAEPAQEENEQFRILVTSVAKALNEGSTPSEVIRELVGNGYSEQAASRFVAQVDLARLGLRRVAPQDARGGGVKNMVIGGVIAGIGTAVTVGTYNSAGPGETYYVAWGAMAFGGIQFFAGLLTLLVGGD